MKRNNLIILLLLLAFIKGYSQIMTTDNQGLKRSSLLQIEKIKKPKKIYDPQTFIIGGFGMHPSQLSFYSMAGYVKNYGFYGKLKTNFNFDGSSDGNIYGDENNRLFLKDKKVGRFSLTGGGLLRINNPLSLYAGIGFGSRWLNWTSISGNIYNVEDYSHKGIEVEGGAIYKYENVFFDVGIQTNSFEYLELNLGIGIRLQDLNY